MVNERDAEEICAWKWRMQDDFVTKNTAFFVLF